MFLFSLKTTSIRPSKTTSSYSWNSVNAPWCGHCKALAPEYAKAATELAEEGSELKLGKVDATEQTELGERFEIRGYPTLKLFREGQPVEYNGGRTAPEIIRWLKKKSGPPATELATADELAAFKEANEVFVLGCFKDKKSEAAETFSKVAATSDDFPFAIASEDAVIAAAEAQDGQVVLFKKFDEGRNVLDKVENADQVKDFVVANSLPLVIDFTHESASKIFGGPIKSHNLLFIDQKAGDFDAVSNNYRESAKQFRGKVLFVTINTGNDDHSRILDFFGIKKSDKPQMRMIRLEDDMAKFKPEDETNLDPAAVSAFVQGVLSGEVKQHLLSQELPEDWDRTPVKVLVAKNFDEIAFDKSKKVLVEFYAPWCGHCKQLVPIYDQLGEAFKDQDDVVIAKLDATANELEHTKVGSFPTLKLYKKETNEVVEYNGERTLEGLKKFIESDGDYGKAPAEDVQEDEEKQEDDEHGPRDEL
ncbi:protein disulfide-isomerase isoform X2 [Galendromus occidentalis]|uniref:Protein disulfide-isomerase n=1 Tax=Galendromus occidentalis TaxID=34638 RepID=A0AAJ7L8A3_9ACAR|nr:protein disulfide-isomerase isoform X2 [Galendromus occidentalis]